MTLSDLTRPIIGIENRTPQEAFDIMCDRIRSALLPTPSVETGRVTDAMRAAAIDAGMQTARKLTALGTSPDYTAMACAQDAIRKLEAALSASPGSSAGTKRS